jgi:hypothetical protein
MNLNPVQFCYLVLQKSRSVSEKCNLKTGSSTTLQVPSATIVHCRQNQTPSTLMGKFGLYPRIRLGANTQPLQPQPNSRLLRHLLSDPILEPDVFTVNRRPIRCGQCWTGINIYASWLSLQ